MSMQILSMPRQFGKTNQMVAWLKGGDNRVLMVFNEPERRRILGAYFSEDERGQMADRIITPSKLPLRGMAQKVIGIDNLDIILRNMVSPNQLGPVTISDIEL